MSVSRRASSLRRMSKHYGTGAIRVWSTKRPSGRRCASGEILGWLRAKLRMRKPSGPPPATPRGLPVEFLARRAVLGGAIAGVGGYLLVKPPLGLWPSLGELSADYRTGKGEQRSFVLKDDVSVQMNTETSLALRSAEDGPEIVIISGEAAITKTGASGTPLRVLAADGRLTTERASFDTRCVGGRVAVTCVEGSIDVQQNQQSVRLQADHQVSYSSQGLSAPVHVDPAEATSWRSGILVFHDRALSEVVDEINRYRPGRIVIMNAELGRRVVNGAFYVKRLDDFLDQVQQLFGARVRSLPAGLTLLS